VRGHTDLALVTRHSSLITYHKFSGNSQRRRKHFLLFHGTFLLDFNLALVSEFLEMPSKQPDYRGDRSHDSFLTNLNLPADKVKAAMQKIWKANSPLTKPPLEKISKLAHEKYSTHEWNWKF
jgi:lipoate-protein ligase A